MAADINQTLHDEGPCSQHSASMCGSDVDWKRRTLELEEQLFYLREKVNSQTVKIREAVSYKIQAAENKALQAEMRTEKLLKTVKELEERMHSAEDKVVRCYERNQHLEDIIEQKESVIRQLRNTVSRQSKSGENNARLFEEKIAKVKEWVEECKHTIADLQLQIQEKEEVIQKLSNVRDKELNSSSSIEDKDGVSNIARTMSKSEMALPQGHGKVNDIVPAIPTRRASLGILHRTKSTPIKSSGRPSLKTLKESNVNSVDKTEASQKSKYVLTRSNSVSCKSETKDEFLDRTYMVLESDNDSIYAVSKKHKLYVSAENTNNEQHMTVKEKSKQLTQSSEEEIEHVSDVELSPAIDKGKIELVDELVKSLESQNSNDLEQHVVTVKFSTDNGMLTAKGVTAAMKSGTESDSTKKDISTSKQSVKLAIKPGTDAKGYTKLIPVDKRMNENIDTSSKTKETFKSYLPNEFLGNRVNSEKIVVESANTSSYVKASWMQPHKVLNPVFNGVITSEEWKKSSDVKIINGTCNGFPSNLNQVLSCPVYAQLEGRASEILDRPCTGDSTDSSDNDNDSSIDCDSSSVSRVKSMSVSDRILRRGSTRKKVLKTCAQYTTHNLKSESPQKAGYLTKLGGRVKNWKRRWFVLSEDKLTYYKTENDTNKKALGQIPLGGFCEITRTEGSQSFQVDTARRKYYMIGESIEEIDDWLKAIQNVLKKYMTSPLLVQINEKTFMKGWMTKIKHGKSKRVYCILRGKILCFYKNENDQSPPLWLNMKEMYVEKSENGQSEELERDDNDEQRSLRFTLRLCNEKQPTSNSVYLSFDNKQNLNAWLYHLTLASGNSLVGTEFEKIIVTLKEENDFENPLWNSSIITHSMDPLQSSLTTLPSAELENKALQLFKSIQLFCDTECVRGPALDYHVANAQNALQMCLTHTELKEEMYCQLIKQTAKHVHLLSESASELERFLELRSEWLTTKRSPSVSSTGTIDLRPIKEYVYEQCWQLLVLCCTLFLPRGHFMWFLEAYLKKCAANETIIGEYAKFCQRCLKRTILNGEREDGPSRMEVLSVLDDPFQKKHSMKISVHFVNNTSEDFGFDAATTVQELIDAINSEIGIRSIEQSGYALYTDNPVNTVEHCLQTSVKVCDVISKWEKAVQSKQGRLKPNRMIRFTYKNRLYFKSLSKNETQTERYFLVYQTFNDVVFGRFPLSKERYTKMAALMAQMEFGDRVAKENKNEERISAIQERFYPRKFRESMTNEQRRQLQIMFLDAWQPLMGKTKEECITWYLHLAKSSATFGTKLFMAKQRRLVTKKRESGCEHLEEIWLAVDENCISILDVVKMNPVFKYKYRSVVTFGGWKEDFMLVVNKTTQKITGKSELGTERLLFTMPRGKVLEITLLVASYINAIVRQQGLTFDVQCTTASSSGAADDDVKVWDMESTDWPVIPGTGLL